MAPKADRSQIGGIASTSSPGATADRQRSRRTDHPHGRGKSVMGYDRIVGALANLGHEVSDGRQRAASSRYTAGAGAQTQDHLGRIHSDPPRVARRDGHFRGRGPYARIGDLLRAVFYIFGEL